MAYHTGGEHFFEVSLGAKDFFIAIEGGGDGLLHGNQGGAKDFLNIYGNFRASQTVAKNC